ncbi:pesticin C-terminus-like muramidase, partial [Bradyrhizobium sp. JYMT SZCCT0428]|uniref:pesticin C-terminus-like muramidase n=1 Tax=Bradyrhizobium sp. JYMT SZCCT0428 TaxID=2807673 RepID=UPI001BAB7670
MWVYQGGSVTNTTLNSGNVVIEGGSATLTTVNSGTLSVGSGRLTSTFVKSNGTVYLGGQGTATSTSIDGGFLRIYSGGVANATLVTNEGQIEIESGGIAHGVEVTSGAIVYLHGSADSFKVTTSGALVINGGTVTNLNIKPGGFVFAETGILNGDIVSHGAQVDVRYSAQAIGVSALGLVEIYSGGRAQSTVVSSGGQQNILAGGIDTGTIIQGDGLQKVASGGLSISASVVGSGTNHSAVAIISSGGLASATTISDSGMLIVQNGGGVISTIINDTHFGAGSNGGLFVSSGGNARLTTINDGGVEVVFNGGTEGSATINNGGRIVVSSGGLTKNTSILASGFERISAGGTASASVISSGGFQVVSSGGVASATMVSSGGTEVVSSGGISRATNVSAAGLEIVTAGGIANATVVQGNGSLNPATAADSGKIYVSSGGTASATTVRNGGYEAVFAGGVLNSATIDGGMVELTSGASASGRIVFAHTGSATNILQIDNFASFSGEISGFLAGDVIDFAGWGNLTLSAAFGNPRTVNVYKQTNLIASLNFTGAIDLDSIEAVNDLHGGTQIVLDTSNVALNDPQPAGYDIQWNFIHERESPGGKISLAPYIPLDQPGVVKGTSGITVGLGVDFGSGIIKAARFAALFPDYANHYNLKFLYDALGKSEALAIAQIETGAVSVGGNETSRSVSITRSQANALTAEAESVTLAELIAIWENPVRWGGHAVVPISDLPSNAQTVLVDVAFQYGPSNMPLQNSKKGTPRFLRLMIEAAKTISPQSPDGSPEAWLEVYKELTHFGDAFFDRRIREAALIFSLIPGATVSLPALVEPIVIASNVSNYNFEIADSSTQYAFDPAGKNVYTLTSDAQTPDFSSIQLPSGSAAAYSVIYLIGSAWSAPQILQPLDVLAMPPGVRGIRVTMLDTSGIAEADPGNFTFYVTFASAGTFSGEVTQLASTPPVITLDALTILPAGVISLTGTNSAVSGISSITIQRDGNSIGQATLGPSTWNFQGNGSGRLGSIAATATDGATATTTAGLASLRTFVFGAGGLSANFTGTELLGTSFVVNGGGFGNNLITVTGSSVDLSNRSFINWGASNQVLILGSSGASNLLFAPAVDTTELGGSANDILHGGAGKDTVYANDGNDSAYGGDGADVLVLGNGNDFGDGGNANDYIYAGAGNDALIGGPGLDVLLGEGGNDSIYGGTGFNYLFGGDGDDLLIGAGGTIGAGDVNVMLGEAGADALYGGAGTNYFYGGTGVDSMFGGSGLNIFISSAETDGNYIYGGSGQNYVYGSNGGDTVTGGAGVDVFLMGAG